MPRIYFAGNSLACIRDTRNLTINHGLIWRNPFGQRRILPPNTRLLLTFWSGPLVGGVFTPLAMCVTRAPAGNEVPYPRQGPCFCIIPAGVVRNNFLAAQQGLGGHGYLQAENPDYVAICVDVVDAFHNIWGNGNNQPHFTPPGHLYGYHRVPNVIIALRNFDQNGLQGNILPQLMRP